MFQVHHFFFLNMNLSETQEYIPVGCLPSAVVAVSCVSAGGGDVCQVEGCLLGVCLPGGGGVYRGGGCLPDTPCEKNDSQV